MAREFRRSGDAIVGRLERVEVEILRGLVAEVVAILKADGSEDPVSRRLFPDPSPDPVVAGEVRDLVHDDLREAKLSAARALLGSLPEEGTFTLDAETSEQWLTALNDLRLALGTTLGVTEESHEREPDDDDFGMQLYHLLTFLQDSLVEAVSAGIGR